MHGIKRRASSFNTSRIDHLYQDPHESDPRLVLHYGDLTDSTNLIRIIQQVQPDEIYNLGAQSHVAVSFEAPEYTANTDALGTLRILEAVRILGLTKKTRLYQASTSELYGIVQEVPQQESTPFYPRSPYGVAKPMPTDHSQLSRGLRHVCPQWDPFQSREPAPRRNLCDPKNYTRPRTDRCRVGAVLVHGQP